MPQHIYRIYFLFCQTSKKVYIGHTKSSLKTRIIEHRSRTKNNSPHHLHRAIRKYGIEDFLSGVLYESWDGKHCLKEMEPYFIRRYQSNDRKKGYNRTSGGEGMLNYVWTEEAKRKAQENWKKNYKKENHPHYGKHLPEETRKKLAERGKAKEHIERLHTMRKSATEAYFEKHAKLWKITLPNGKKRIIKGLKKFCRENKLDSVMMRNIADGKRSFPHRRYWCERV